MLNKKTGAKADAIESRRYEGEMPHPLRCEEPTALEILCRRYARGEIDTATFTQMRERLEEAQEKQERESVAG